jgi:IS5 family transposase
MIRREVKEVRVDTTVQEKNITYPTDRKLYEKTIERCKRIA